MLLSKKPEYGIFRHELFALAGSKGGIFPSVNTALKDEYTRSSLPFLLKAADRNSMRWSIESRMPFADFHPLVEAVFAMPGSAKIQQEQTKYLLRKAAAPFVPSVILQRRDKVGFAAPNREWLSVLLKSDFVRDLPAMPDFLDEKSFQTHRLRFLANPDAVDPLVLWRGLGLKVWGKGIQKSMSFS
jgi:asparagine synthase (glutamine-hydrolysing)